MPARVPARACSGVTGASPEALQKTYGINSPIGRKAIRRKLQLSSAVCRICGPRNGEMQGMATGFAIRGDLLHESLGPGPVIVTNNHVRLDARHDGRAPARNCARRSSCRRPRRKISR